MFGNILAGNLDGACFRYTMLLCDFIDQVEWKEVEDFRVFAGIAYRSMDVSSIVWRWGKDRKKIL